MHLFLTVVASMAFAGVSPWRKPIHDEARAAAKAAASHCRMDQYMLGGLRYGRLISHGFFSPPHSAELLGVAMGLTAAGSGAVASLSFPMRMTPGGFSARFAAVGLPPPATPAHAKPQAAPFTCHLTHQHSRLPLLHVRGSYD